MAPGTCVLTTNLNFAKWDLNLVMKNDKCRRALWVLLSEMVPHFGDGTPLKIHESQGGLEEYTIKIPGLRD